MRRLGGARGGEAGAWRDGSTGEGRGGGRRRRLGEQRVCEASYEARPTAAAKLFQPWLGAAHLIQRQPREMRSQHSRASGSHSAVHVTARACRRPATHCGPNYFGWTLKVARPRKIGYPPHCSGLRHDTLLIDFEFRPSFKRVSTV